MAAGLASVAVLAGCGTPRAPVTPGVVKVVAGENFWGNIAGQIGGRHVQVTSILSNPNTDPHEYEADVASAMTVAEAGWSSPTGRAMTISCLSCSGPPPTRAGSW